MHLTNSYFIYTSIKLLNNLLFFIYKGAVGTIPKIALRFGLSSILYSFSLYVKQQQKSTKCWQSTQIFVLFVSFDLWP